jgi:AMP-activated protein kinase-like protein
MAFQFECGIPLAPGQYTYKFIVDGNWITDPANPKTAEDEAGNVNSVLVIEEKNKRPGNSDVSPLRER